MRFDSMRENFTVHLLENLTSLMTTLVIGEARKYAIARLPRDNIVAM